MTKQHTMAPGRVVHWLPGPHTAITTCKVAVIERGSADGTAELVPITAGFTPAFSMRAVPHNPKADLTSGPSWHWTDECPFEWPETD